MTWDYNKTEYEKQALDYIASESRLSNYYLSGGTALTAYYFGHRISDDLDFFTVEDARSTLAMDILSNIQGTLQSCYRKTFRL